MRSDTEAARSGRVHVARYIRLPIAEAASKLETGGKLKSTPDQESVGAGGDDVVGFAAICAETCVITASALLMGEWAVGTTGGIHIHGGMRGKVGRWGTGRGEREIGFGVVRKAGRWRLVVGARGGSRRLVKLDRDGSRQVSLKGSGESATGG